MTAREERRSCPIVDLNQDFSLFNTEKDLSASAEVIGTVRKIDNRIKILGKTITES